MARWFLDRSAHAGIPSVSLRKLLSDAWFPSGGDLLVSGCSSDARRLEPGEVFVAVASDGHDGHDDVELALARGAAAVVVERPSPEAGRLQVVVPDSRKALGSLAHALAGDPGEQLSLSAFCGSTGADAASTFLRSVLEAAGQRVGVIGPREWTDGQSIYPSRTSEPSPSEVASLLGRMIDRQCASALVCLSPKAIARGSAEALTPAETVILNVRAPGLDTDQFQQTRRVFSKLARGVVPTGTVVVNADDPDAELLGGVHLNARRVAFAIEGQGEVRGEIEHLDADGSRLRILGFGRDLEVNLRPSGRLAVESALAAAAVAWSRGVGEDAVIDGLEAVGRLKGRLEPVLSQDGVDVRLEYPRSEADLARSLLSMRDWVPGTLTCLLSAGSDEARNEALKSAAGRFADRVEVSGHDLADPGDREGSGFERILSHSRPGDGVLLVGLPQASLIAGRARKTARAMTHPVSRRRSA
jgi:UDP-N-acetylmuramoyl-L-alanyl-D-glutamate--2,6-diaminopimelate ligase